MNSKFILRFAVCGAFALVISCGKKEEAAPSAQSEAPKAVTAPVVEAPKVVTAPVAEVQKAVETKAAPVQQAAATQAQSTAAQATDMAKGAIEKAQALMADKKYADALTSLQSLAGQSLSPDMKSMVDGLIKQAQQAMAAQAAGQATSEATKTLGGLFGGKK
ncbi:MAG: hypothetical protein NT105_14375 [Verrucomicrobia bacterium]|nr:hypothetical protein [Verrucomicrobiota bacterium]